MFLVVVTPSRREELAMKHVAAKHPERYAEIYTLKSLKCVVKQWYLL